MENYLKILNKSALRLKENKSFYEKLKSRKPKDLDGIISDFHDAVFEEMDCLQCANCCKTTSPVFKDTDIERIARHLRIKPSAFTEKYLHLDDEQDYVLNNAPCPFLDAENYCLIYEARPVACKEYPHTNRKRFYQLIPKTINNLSICPAVFLITEKLKNFYLKK